MDEDFFPNRIKDLEGVAIRIALDQLEPWSLVLRNRNDGIEIGGFLARFVREFSNLCDTLARYQTYLSQPLSYMSKQLYLIKGIPMVMTIQSHSIYNETFNIRINRYIRSD